MSKDPKRYEKLAAWGRGQGYPKLTASTVHSWVKLRLLPKAVVSYPAFSRRTVEEPEDIESALLAACRYRFGHQIRQIGLVGVLMWMDGLIVGEPLVRRGLRLLAESPSRLVAAVARRSDVQPGDLESAMDAAAVTAVRERQLARWFRPGKPPLRPVDQARLTIAISDWIRLLLTGAPLDDPEELRAFGLMDINSDVDIVRGLIEVAPHLKQDDLIQRIDQAPTASLERARARANEWLGQAADPPPVFRALMLLAEFAVGELPQRVK